MVSFERKEVVSSMIEDISPLDPYDPIDLMLARFQDLDPAENSLSFTDENGLIKRGQEGDKEASRQLFSHFKGLIAGLAIGTRAWEEAAKSY